MKFQIRGDEFREIYRLHDLAFDQMDSNSFGLAYKYANEGINKLNNNKNSSFFSSITKIEVISNLYFIRAKSLERIEPNIEKYFDMVSSDYKNTINILREANLPNETFFSAINAYSDMLKTFSLETKTSYWGEILKYLSLAKQEADLVSTELNDCKIYILSRLGTCHGYPIENLVYDVEKAIKYIKISHDYYTKQGDRESILLAKDHLAHLYYDRSTQTQDHTDVEKAILYIEEYFKICDENDENIGLFGGFLGKIFLHKNTISRHVNIDSAYEILNTAHGMIDPVKHPVVWSRVGIDLIDSLLQKKEWASDLSKIIEIKNTCEEVVKKIFVIQETDFNPLLMFDLLSIKRRLGTAYDDYTPGDNLEGLYHLAQKIKGDKNFEDIWIDTQLALVREMSSNSSIKEIIAVYEEILLNVEIDKWPAYCFDVYIELGRLFGELDNPQEISKNYKKAMNLLFCYREENLSLNPASLRKQLNSSDRLILTIPSAILKTDDPILALQYQEFLRFHPVTNILEELLLIENQVNRKHWMFKHKMSKMAELFINSMEPGSEKNNIISKNENYYKEIGELKKRFHNLTEFNFISSLENNIEKLSCWTLVPVLENNQITLLLIPPNSNISEIIVSDPIPSGLVDILKEITRGDNDSWINSITGYAQRLNEIERITDPVEKESCEIAFHEGLEVAMKRMKTYLWKIYGDWIKKTLLTNKVNSPIHLCIIGQGPLALLPFCLAQNPDDGIYLLDLLKISYAPSLYALFSLQNRLNFWRKPEKLGFVVDTSSNNDEMDGYTLPTWSIEQNLCFSAFDQVGGERSSVENLELKELQRVCKASTHWHVSAHGKFDYTYFEKSSIEFGKNGIITPALLSVLECNEFLRLVVLSACQTGMSETLDKELSPESFLTELLKSGTIGAIGTLWEVPDVSASFILGRFYHFHLIEKQEPAGALRSAQIWLRDLTYFKFKVFVEQYLINNDCQNASNFLLETLRDDGVEDDECPFENPMFWAGFILVGL